VATNDDAPGIARLINQAFRVEDFFKAGDRTTAAGVLELMGAGEFLVVDGQDGEPTVAVYVSRSDGRGYFGMLSVDPRVQGKGLGRQVIDAVEDRCRRAGCAWMDIYVVSLRPALTGFYQKLGYSASGTKEFPDPEELTEPCHLIVMTKAL
jgi:GNAT superfamily N-acetyltransferase